MKINSHVSAISRQATQTPLNQSGALSGSPTLRGVHGPVSRSAVRIGCISVFLVLFTIRLLAQPAIPMEWNYFPEPSFETVYNSYPVWVTNVFSVPVGIFWGMDSALVVDTTNLEPAGIQYAVMDSNWIQNITFDNGTILFCVSPNWASVSAGGSGPGSAKSYLICGGDFSTDAPNGRFEIYVDSGGSNLVFGGFINGISTTYASTEISWTSNTWHQLGFEYKSGRSTLRSPGSKIFVDSGLAATGGSVTIVPALGADSNGFCTNVFAIGSDGNGMEQGRSSFYDIVTWSAPYGGWYTNDWLWLSNALVAWQGTLSGGSGFGAMMGLGTGMDTGSDVGAGTVANLGYMDGVTYTTNYADYTNFWLAIGTSGSSLQPTIQNTQSNLSYQILTNSSLDPNLSNWNVWQTLLASNSVIVAPPLSPGPSALFFDAALVWTTTTNGLPDWYEMEYFGNLNQPATGFYDGGTLNNGEAYSNGVDPNIITFTVSFTNQYVNVTDVPLWLGIQGGVPYSWAVTLDNTNFAAASWTPYTSSNITANLGTNHGWHTVWVGLRGLPANAQQTWNSVRLYLDVSPPLLFITQPLTSTVSMPVMQLLGFSAKDLSSISYDLSNANGFVSNQQVLVLDEYYDTGVWAFTTNWFQAFDVPLAAGLNTFTLHAGDDAGNVTVTNITFTLDESTMTNPPAVQIIWPAEGSMVSGTNFTCRGWVSDPTATVTTSALDANGNTNLYTAAVGRDGNFWLQNIPLNAGTTQFAIYATNVVGSNTVTNITITQSGVALTINLDQVPPDSLWQPTVSLTGTISDTNDTVWVNGVQGTNNGDGTWSASNVPVNAGPCAAFDVAAFASGGVQSDADLSGDTPKPLRVFVSSYTESNYTGEFLAETNYGLADWAAGVMTNYIDWVNYMENVTNTVKWSDGLMGTENQSSSLLENFADSTLDGSHCGYVWTYWPASSWPDISAGISWVYDTNINPIATNSGPACPIIFEHCDIQVPCPDESGTFTNVTFPTIWINNAAQTGTRNADAKIRIQTFGPPGSTAQHLYVFNCSATNMPLVKQPPPDFVPVGGPPTPIPPQNISIGKLGRLGANGNLYSMLPDNTNVDITPNVTNVPYYTFGATNGAPVGVTLIQVTFSMTNGQRIGISSSSTNRAQTCYAAVSPSTETTNITITNVFPYTGGKLYLSNMVNMGNGNVSFSVVGTAPSSKACDTLVEAIHSRHSAWNVGTNSFSLIVPSAVNNPHPLAFSPTGLNVAANSSSVPPYWEKIPAPYDTILQTLYVSNIVVPVVDQFTNACGDLYDGSPITETPKRFPIHQFLSNSAYFDTVGRAYDAPGNWATTQIPYVQLPYVQGNSTQGAAVKASWLAAPPGVSLQSTDGTEVNIGRSIQVDGFELNPSAIGRTLSVNPPVITIHWPGVTNTN